jgi:hypothetical protein
MTTMHFVDIEGSGKKCLAGTKCFLNNSIRGMEENTWWLQAFFGSLIKRNPKKCLKVRRENDWWP